MGASVFCQGCGTSINADFRFCGECGARQEAVPDVASSLEPVITSAGPALAFAPAVPAPAHTPEAGPPMYRPGVPDPDGASAKSAARTAAIGVGAIARGAGSLFEFVLRWGVTALWVAAAVLLFSQGQVVPGLACLVYVAYLLNGGGWLIW